MEETTLVRATGAATIAEAFRITAEEHPDRVAVRTKDDEISLTWSELRERVDALAGGLARLGVKRGDKVALMLLNRPEFHIADLAVMTLGATPFSIYATYTREQIEYLVEDSGATVALIESAFAERFPELEHVLVLEDGWPADEEFDAEPHWRAIEPDDEITLIYTSGTTGPPKGVQLVAPQPDDGGAVGRGADPVPRRLTGHLVAAGRPHRRADGAPLPAGRLRDDDHLLPEPARGGRVPAGGQADVVLRRAAHLGEAQGRSRSPRDARRERRAARRRRA